MHKLIAVVGVDKDSRVYCQSPGCIRTVYKKIHVVSDNGKIVVLGCKCYEVLYGGMEKSEEPFYSLGNSRLLTEEERTLLLENTQLLIESFENEEREAKRAQYFHDQPTHPVVFKTLCHFLILSQTEMTHDPTHIRYSGRHTSTA